MSTTSEIAIFPLDKGSSVSEYVSKVIEMIRNQKISYQLTAMGTIIETNTLKEALIIIEKAHDILAEHSDRIYCTAKFDINKNKTNSIERKIQSIESKIGTVST